MQQLATIARTKELIHKLNAIRADCEDAPETCASIDEVVVHMLELQRQVVNSYERFGTISNIARSAREGT